MAVMGDSVDYTAIPTDVDAVAGYIDGAKYPWPAEAWPHFAGKHVLRVSVLANPDAMGFDSEPQNAGVDEVATAVAIRVGRGAPSVVYTNHAGLAPLQAALNAKSVTLYPVGSWPSPGAYLWAADPTIQPGQVPAWCPVHPVAVQDRWEKTYDLSTLYHGWLPPAEPVAAKSSGTPTTEPAPTTPGPTYVTAPDEKVRYPHSVCYVPTTTLAEAVTALTSGREVFVWTAADDVPVTVATVADLHDIEHTGDHAYTQYVTYLAEPIA